MLSGYTCLCMFNNGCSKYFTTGGILSIMGLYQIFKDAAYERMTRHGFIHQSNVFIRILGGEIVQAVTVKHIAGYEITAAIFPLCDPPTELFWDTRKPYWAENISLTFKGFLDFPHTDMLGLSRTLKLYFPKDEESSSYTVENLHKVAELLEEFYIPRFDRICDLDSYLEWASGGYEDYARIYRRIGDKSLLYKACSDGNFDWVDGYVEKCISKWLKKEFGVYSCIDSYSKEELESNPKYLAIKESIDKYKVDYKKEFDKIYCYKDNGDFAGAKMIVDTERERTLDALRKKYSKLKL